MDSRGTLVDFGGTTTGASQLAAPANPYRHYLLISNPDNAAILYVDFGQAASANSVRIQPGANLIFEVHIPTDAVNVFGAAAGKAFAVKEG